MFILFLAEIINLDCITSNLKDSKSWTETMADVDSLNM